MTHPGQSHPTAADVQADLCIVGAGPAGLTVARQLLRSGLKVVVLESGPAPTTPGGEPYATSSSVGIDYPLGRSRVRGLGGSANHWDIQTPVGGPRVRLRELDDLDFRDRPGVRSPGWPFSRSLLDPYYRRARTLLDLQAAEADDDQPFRGTPPGGTGTSLVVQRLFSFAAASTFTVALPEQLAADAHTTMLADTWATRLCTSSDGSVTALDARTRHGRPFSIRARAYVLAAGGIENPRLLLASSRDGQTGLAARSDKVGRYFMEHAHYTSGLLVPGRPARHLPNEAWDVFLRSGHPVQHKYGLTPEVQQREGLLNTAYFLTPRPASWLVPLTRTGREDAQLTSAVRHVRQLARSRTWTPGAQRDLAATAGAVPLMAAYAVRQHKALAAAQAGRQPGHPVVFTLGGMAEHQPNAESVVRLGSRVDPFGVPEAELSWQVTDADLASMRRSHELLAPVLAKALGARSVALLPPDERPGLGVGYHHLGTTRISSRPEDGVVDADLRLHDTPNLFVAGSSVFPTGGSANPTLTIVALAIRLADLLRRELAPVAVR
jgi:choline dehydrogenase-like flavoprotein